MERVNTKSYKAMHAFIVSLIVLIGALFATTAKASPTSTLSGTQLAYFVGTHYAPGYVYHAPPRVYHHRPRSVYWTNWRYIGHGCKKSCLIDRWSHRVIRCKQVCSRYHGHR